MKEFTLPLDAAEREDMAVRAADKIASDYGLGIQLGCCPQGALFGKDIQLITKVGPTGNPFSQLGWQP